MIGERPVKSEIKIGAMDADLSIGEIGRLFQSRQPDLESIWAPAQYEVFLWREKVIKENEDNIHKFGMIDPIYTSYVRNEKCNQEEINQLRFYLILNREEYDRQIRRANRKRVSEWQERSHGYVVRYPQTINDLCRESVYMSHCLLGYVEAVVHNDTTVLFMRKPDSVNVPFITIEVYDGELMQAYHRFNQDCTPEEADWIREYCNRQGIGCMKFSFNRAVDQLF